MGERFTGFPRAATEFFRDLARNNNRDWFQAHREVYELACRDPLKALITELDPVGSAHLSRINRDMRFSRDGAPYKTHIAGGVGRNYINLSSAGLWIGTGMYRPEPAVLRQLRSAIAADTSGTALATIVGALRRKGYDVDTHESLDSTPRGFDAGHPRIVLLRMKDIYSGRLIEPGPVLASRKSVAAVKKIIADVAPLGAWLSRYVG